MDLKSKIISNCFNILKQKQEDPIFIYWLAKSLFAANYFVLQFVKKKNADLKEKNLARLKELFLKTYHLENPYLRKPFEIDQFDGYTFFTSPLEKGFYLADFLEKNNTIAVNIAFRIIAQITSGLKGLSQAKIHHNLLTPNNIWVDEITERTAKIRLDNLYVSPLYGEWEWNKQQKALLGFNYISPDFLNYGLAADSEKNDFYSLALLFYRMIHGSLPDNPAAGLSGSHFSEIMKSEKYSGEYKRAMDLIEKLIRQPEQFSTMSGLLEYILTTEPWLTEGEDRIQLETAGNRYRVREGSGPGTAEKRTAPSVEQLAAPGDMPGKKRAPEKQKEMSTNKAAASEPKEKLRKKINRFLQRKIESVSSFFKQIIVKKPISFISRFITIRNPRDYQSRRQTTESEKVTGDMKIQQVENPEENVAELLDALDNHYTQTPKEKEGKPLPASYGQNLFSGSSKAEKNAGESGHRDKEALSNGYQQFGTGRQAAYKKGRSLSAFFEGLNSYFRNRQQFLKSLYQRDGSEWWSRSKNGGQKGNAGPRRGSSSPLRKGKQGISPDGFYEQRRKQGSAQASTNKTPYLDTTFTPAKKDAAAGISGQPRADSAMPSTGMPESTRSTVKIPMPPISKNRLQAHGKGIWARIVLFLKALWRKIRKKADNH